MTREFSSRLGVACAGFVAAGGLGIAVAATPVAAQADAVDDLLPGAWLEIPNTRMRDVCPPDTPEYDWSFHCQNAIGAWSGGVQDTARGRLIVWGGGHADYKGNEVYAFDMLGLSWSRPWGPTPDAQIPSSGAVEVYDDGNPGSRHTYSGLGYLPPPHDAMIAFGGSLWISGSFGAATWRFDFGSNAWTRMTEGPSEQGYGDATVYDPMTGHLFRRSNSRMLEYDPDADVLIDRADSDGGFFAANVSTDLDLATRTMVIIGEGRLDLYHLDTDVYERDVAVVGPSVSALFGGGSPGVAYEPMEGRIVVWGGGQDVYTLDLSGPTFLQHAGTGDDPGSITPSGGAFGRFRYAPSRNVFVYVDSVDTNVFVYRMSEGTGVPPEPPEPGGDESGGTDTSGSASGGATDGGATDTGGGEAGESDSAGGSGGADGGEDDSGCSCRSGGSTAWGWLMLGLVAFARARRRA